MVVGDTLPTLDAAAPIRLASIRTALDSSLVLIPYLAAFAPETNRALASLMYASLLQKSPWILGAMMLARSMIDEAGLSRRRKS